MFVAQHRIPLPPCGYAVIKRARTRVRTAARLVLYQLATNTAIPDDKAERVAGVRGQPGPVAGVRPISGLQPAGHSARSAQTIVFCLRLAVRRTPMNCKPKSRDRPCPATGCSEFLLATTDRTTIDCLGPSRAPHLSHRSFLRSSTIIFPFISLYLAFSSNYFILFLSYFSSNHFLRVSDEIVSRRVFRRNENMEVRILII